LIPELVDEAAKYAQASPEDCGEVHVVAINVNPEFTWEGKMPYEQREAEGRTIHVWGF
jgi:hypothetical protein